MTPESGVVSKKNGSVHSLVLYFKVYSPMLTPAVRQGIAGFVIERAQTKSE